MQLKRLPPSLLLALGLPGCGPSVVIVESSGGDTESGGSAEGPMTSATNPTSVSNSGPTSADTGSDSGSGSDADSGSTSSPTDPTIPGTGCLSPPWTSSSSTTDDINFIEPETSACLGPPNTTTGFTSGFTDTSSGSGDADGTGSSSTSSTTGATAAADRDRTLQRLHERGVLPRDVLDQLQRRRG